MPERYRAVVAADQARALRDQRVVAGRGVVYRLRHPGDDLPRQVEIDVRQPNQRLHRIDHLKSIRTPFASRALIATGSSG